MTLHVRKTGLIFGTLETSKQKTKDAKNIILQKIFNTKEC